MSALKKRIKHPVLEKLKVENIGAEGKAIAKHNGLIVFTTNLVPGDVADIKIRSKHKNYMQGYPVKIHKYSTKRITPFCDHFGVCGGCKWQQLQYEEQLRYKHQHVIENLKRIGKTDLPEINSIIPSGKQINYRNKLEFAFSDNRWFTDKEIRSDSKNLSRKALGFHIQEMFNRVLDIKKCYLQEEPSNDIRNAVRDYALENQLDFFNHKKKEGFLRNLILRNTSTGEWMIIFSFYKEEKEVISGLLRYISQEFPEITSILYVINPKGNDTINDLSLRLYKGRNYITEEIGDYKFKIGPKSFFQPNTALTGTLYKIVSEFSGLTGDEIVYDLYTGIGTIANFISGYCRKVIGIDYIPEAIEDAKENSRINNISNTEFISGDVIDIFTEQLVMQKGHPDVIIVDPPRSGMHKKVINKLLTLKPVKIVYVSCNTATQARDINLLSVNYRISKIQPVDMFPHTHHIENIMLLETL
ncbi:MAG: 23S rRNA (uracil(1939)-C(5))-methyltransferase RlmD [Bacteroidales bacterium]|nr:MAG: 23S rRNA (uracil(1939)-C(5))-methyltransferase RlmD [Bacteroidales bacterium]